MFSVFHFNDVYNIEERSSEPVGGASRMATLVKNLRADNEDLKVVFGGDALSPSLISTVTRGNHIPPIFNELNVDYAVCGNHDFDFGAPRLKQMIARCNFPWLLANIVFEENGKQKPLAEAKEYLIEEINGVKVGIIGLAEEEWLACLTKLPESTKYLDQAEIGEKIAKQLRAEGCQVIVAITHSREPQDSYLARNCPEIDIILGGHDHDYYIRNVNSIPILHSGSEFREATLAKIFLNSEIIENPENPPIDDSATSWRFVGRRVTCEITKLQVTSDIPKDPEMVKVVEKLNASVKAKMGKTLGLTAVPWDVRFENCRLKENHVGSFLCDLMREGYKTDMALLCGGTLRSNDVYPAGDFKLETLMKIFPFPDTVSIGVFTGKTLRAALENGFSAYPTPEGRFPQISGPQIEVDPSRPPGNRIVKFEINGKELSDDEEYTLATKPYLMSGGDGYAALKNNVRMIVGDEGIPLATLIRNYFTQLKVANALGRAQRIQDIVATAFTPESPKDRRVKAEPTADGRIKIL